MAEKGRGREESEGAARPINIFGAMLLPRVYIYRMYCMVDMSLCGGWFVLGRRR
jgi:hypothetical protein